MRNPLTQLADQWAKDTAQAVKSAHAAADANAVKQRRKVAHNVRTARERLTSSVGLERSFEVEFLRLFRPVPHRRRDPAGCPGGGGGRGSELLASRRIRRACLS